MRKIRIVKRESPNWTRFVLQRRWFGLFWMDIDAGWSGSFQTYEEALKDVAKYDGTPTKETVVYAN